MIARAQCARKHTRSADRRMLRAMLHAQSWPRIAHEKISVARRAAVHATDISPTRIARSYHPLQKPQHRCTCDTHGLLESVGPVIASTGAAAERRPKPARAHARSLAQHRITRSVVQPEPR
ncbi:hypothetical protein BURMUCGD2_4261 [Burkholderia multivorans CGD2]|uniref:Uncharacterized protein n=1 Tax=Burkholderia multivorans CGD2 TaxID=513052 RepID=B9BS93_9BURK|nr:hypothetical protein BURMUCGD2_4261 [Burkholderia multivorans CGD2]